jgi:hypothetical protein
MKQQQGRSTLPAHREPNAPATKPPAADVTRRTRMSETECRRWLESKELQPPK